MIHKPPELPGQLAITPETHQVVVPYVLDHLSDETTDAVMAWGGPYTFETIDPEDPGAYLAAFSRWWHAGLDLLTVEQSAKVPDGVIRGMLACPKPWCVRAYHASGLGQRWDHGVMKISAQVIATSRYLPNLIEERYAQDDVTPGWREVDTEVIYALRVLGHTEHVHYLTSHGREDDGERAGGG